MLVLIVLIGAFLRFFNLMWGNGNFFHPDEGNMARSISQMTFEKGLHPDFFAYGQFPLYISYFFLQFLYFAATYLNPTSTESQTFLNNVRYEDAIWGLRFFAALFSTLTIPIVYLIVHDLTKKDSQNNQKTSINHLFNFSANDYFYPLMAALLTAVLPGLIQSAHFGTTESLLTFMFTLVIYLSLLLLRTKRKIFWLFLAIGTSIGLGMGTKITALFFFVPPFIALLFSNIEKHSSRTRQVLVKIGAFALILVTAGVFFAVSSPYSLLAWENFWGTSQYESQVATGQVQVFYTRQFIETIPFLFQLEHVFPSVLGLGLTVVSVISFFILPFLISKRGSSLLRKQYLVLAISFLFFLIPNSMLFVKWTRFLTPTFPLFVIFTSLTFYLIENYVKRPRIMRIIFAILTVTTIVVGLNFASIYMREDVRMTASRWIYKNIPKGSYILYDTGNVVDIPIHIDQGKDKTPLNTGEFAYKTVSFDFYGLDENPQLQSELIEHLTKADYIFVPSRRIFANHMRFPEKFPITNHYYEALFNRRLGFEKVSEFASYPSFFGLSFPDESAEETWTVFDHPVVRIYKKTQKFSQEYYHKVLKI